MTVKAAALPYSRSVCIALRTFAVADLSRSEAPNAVDAVRGWQWHAREDGPDIIASVWFAWAVFAAGSLFMQPTQANVHRNAALSSVQLKPLPFA